FDVFGIFSEYNGIENNPPTDLETRISQVKRMVSEGLASSNQNEGFKIYHKFVREYEKEWNIISNIITRRYIAKSAVR
ncbi:MAG: hypothetical protein ABIJ05_03270, partial [Patescibacteria group bacterium]